MFKGSGPPLSNNTHSPLMQAYKRFKIEGKGSFTSSSTFKGALSAGNVHLVESIGFSSRVITGPLLQRAWELVDCTVSDTNLNSNFDHFVQNYAGDTFAPLNSASKQSGMLEFLLTVALASLSSDLKAVTFPNEKSRIIGLFQKLGDHLLEFEKTTKKLLKAKPAAKSGARNFGDFETVKAAVPTYTAPPSSEKGWVKIKLIYEDDGEPLANQKYVITDCEGTEHSGVTDDNGVARLTDLPKGEVEISFPEVKGWS